MVRAGDCLFFAGNKVAAGGDSLTALFYLLSEGNTDFLLTAVGRVLLDLLKNGQQLGRLGGSH